MSRSFLVKLPYPPTANKLFLNMRGKGRVKTPRYREWGEVATCEIRRQLPGFKVIEGPYYMQIRATRPDRRRRDLANLEKPLSDALVSAGVVSDDSNLANLLMFWTAETVKGGTIEIIVKEAA